MEKNSHILSMYCISKNNSGEILFDQYSTQKFSFDENMSSNFSKTKILVVPPTCVQMPANQ